MIQHFKYENNELLNLKRAEPNSWINIYPPFDKKELEGMSARLNIPLDFFIDALDVDERSRFEIEDGIQFIVLNVPIRLNGRPTEAIFTTIPIGIIENKDYVITISSSKNLVIDKLIETKKFHRGLNEHSYFVLDLFEVANTLYLSNLKELNKLRNDYENELYNSSRNSELANLLNIQKALVYFVTSLRSNELMFMKIKRTDFLKIENKEMQFDYLDDIIVDCSQALEMSNIYTNIMNGTMDAFASIISNNLNNIMKRLTSVTIVLTLPTLIASIFGMNVKLPFESNPFAFIFVIVFAVIVSLILAMFLIKKNWW